MSKESKIITPSEEEITSYGGEHGQDARATMKPEPGVASSQSATAAGQTEAEPSPGRSEADDWKEKFLRSKAELSNYQKRAERDRQEGIRYAISDLVRALLPMVDDLDRVIATGASEESTVKQLVEGARLTRDNFLKVLQQFHVQPIESEGQPFDPQLHEAVMEQPSREHADRTVLKEVARGYRLFDRVLRPAKVIVSKSSDSQGQ
jgi:molecular chaperone GrpE